MNRTYLTLLALGIFILTGCNSPSPLSPSTLDEALDKASKVSDPVVAYNLLKDADAKTEVNAFSQFDTNFYKALNRYMMLSVDLMDTDAIHDLYQKKDVRYNLDDAGTDFVEITKFNEKKRIELAPKILELAEKSNDSKLLVLASEIQSDGEYVIRDTYAAISYLARAWALGDKKAANKAAWLYKSVNDFQNAYLWSLRCTNECERSSSLDLYDLEQKLAPETTKFIQKKAADPTVFEIDTKV